MSEENSGQFKFDNCAHRSAEKEKTTVHRCACDGGNYEAEGFKCITRSIFDVKAENCQYCWIFKDKNST